jgi:hypothetical protein
MISVITNATPRSLGPSTFAALRRDKEFKVQGSQPCVAGRVSPLRAVRCEKPVSGAHGVTRPTISRLSLNNFISL